MLWFIHFSSSLIHIPTQHNVTEGENTDLAKRETWYNSLDLPGKKKQQKKRRNIFCPACRNVWGQTAFREWRNPASAELQIQSCRRFTWGHPLCSTLKNKKECVSGRPQRKFKGSVKGLRASSWRFCSAAAEKKETTSKGVWTGQFRKVFSWYDERCLKLPSVVSQHCVAHSLRY